MNLSSRFALGLFSTCSLRFPYFPFSLLLISQILFSNTSSLFNRIVAVHGLGANPIYSWTKSVSKSEAERRLKDGFDKSDSKRINWLKEFLPKTFPKAHIVAFGYNAGWLINAPDKTSEESAKELLHDLHSNREREGIKVGNLLRILKEH